MKTLIQKCIDGDRYAQNKLYRTYMPAMFAICIKYTKTKQDAEDALQNGFMKVFINLQKFRGEGSFDGWMKRIFINESLSLWRATKVYEDLQQNIKDQTETGLDKLYEQDLKKEIISIPIGYRKVFQMFNFGYTHREIGKALNINESTSKSQYFRARKWLMNRVA